MKYIMDHTMELEFKLKQSYNTTRTVVHTTNAVTLMEILEEFQMFLEVLKLKKKQMMKETKLKLVKFY